MPLHEVRLAVRALVRRPSFALLGVSTVAVGAVASASVAAVAYSILVKPLPYASPHELVAVWPDHFVSQADLRYLRSHARGLSRISAIAPGWSFSLTGAGDPVKATIDRVSGDLLATLGTPPRLGRMFRPDEDTPGRPGVLILSHRFWTARFGADPAIVGRIVRLDSRPHEIVGVMPPAFEVFRPGADGWAPLPADPAAFYDRLNFSLLVGRLDAATPLAQADRDFRALMPAMRRDLHYDETFGRTAQLVDLRTSMIGEVRAPLLVLAAAVGFILLIAGANLGTLLVARATARAQEFAVHAAIGASRATLFRLQLYEGIVLAIAGVAMGLIVARWSLPLLVAWLPRDTPLAGEIALDPVVAAAVVMAALAVVLVFAAAPSLAASQVRSAISLRAGSSTESRTAARARGLLVALQIALSLVLAIGAGLMLQTLARLARVNPGIEVDRLLTLRLQPSSARYRAPGAALAYYERVFERVGGLPGVAAIGAIQHLPFSGINWVDAFELEEQPVPAGQPRPVAGWKTIAGQYFSAVGQPIVAGRDFSPADGVDGTDVIIVNAAFARRYFGSASAAPGRRLRLGRRGGDWRTIVGVAGDVRTASLAKPPEPELFTLVGRQPSPALMLAVRTRLDPVAVAPAVRAAIWEIDPDVPIAELQSMRALIGTTLARRREIGIRMALGADRRAVVALMLRESAVYAAAGLAAGIAIATAVSGIMRTLVFDVAPTDRSTYAALTVFVAAVAVLASYLPARRAANLDPSETLRL
jgi:putative ABC transport system permease protein